jgi:hypothetical protein
MELRFLLIHECRVKMRGVGGGSHKRLGGHAFYRFGPAQLPTSCHKMLGCFASAMRAVVGSAVFVFKTKCYHQEEQVKVYRCRKLFSIKR